MGGSEEKKQLEQEWEEGGGYIVRESAVSWLVLIAGFMGQAMSMGFYYAFGPVYVAIMNEYKVNETTAAWIGSLAYSICFLAGFVSSYLCERISCRFVMMSGAVLASLGFITSSFAYNANCLFVTYGVITSLGMSGMFFSSLLCQPLYFHRRLVLANGIASSGSGIGGLALSPLVQFLISNFGLRKSFQIFAAMYSLPFLASLLIRRRPHKRTKYPSLLSTIFDRALLKNRAFLLYSMAMAMILFAYYIPYVHLVNLVEHKGISKERAALLMGIMTAAAVVGKLLYGKLSEIRWFSRLYVAQFALLCLSVSLTICTLCSSFTHFVIFVVIYGIFDGGYCSYIFVLCNEVVMRQKLSVAFGMMYTFSSFFSLAGPPFAGALYTMTKSYETALIICGGVFLVGALMLFVIPFILPEEVRAEKNLSPLNLKAIDPPKDGGGVEGGGDSETGLLKKKLSETYSTDSGIDSGRSSDHVETNILLQLVDKYLDFSTHSLTRHVSTTPLPYVSDEMIEKLIPVDRISVV